MNQRIARNGYTRGFTGEELFDSLLSSMAERLEISTKSVEEQVEDFFSKTNMMTLVVMFLMNKNREGMLKDLTPELRNYILGFLEEGENKAKQDVQVLQKRDGDGQRSTIGDK